MMRRALEIDNLSSERLIDNQAERLGLSLESSQRFQLKQDFDRYLARIMSDEALDVHFSNGRFCSDLNGLERPKWTLQNPADFFEMSQSNDPAERLKGYIMVERERAQHLAKIIQSTLLSLPELPEGECVDVGYRSGALVNKLNTMNNDIEWRGLDLDSTAEALRSRYDYPMQQLHSDNRTFEKYDGRRMPYQDGSVSVMTLNMVLHHVETDKEIGGGNNALAHFLDECKRSLAPNGRLLIMEDFIGNDNPESPFLDVIKGIDDVFYPHAPGEQRPTKEWCKILESHGFEIERTRKFAGYNAAGFPVIEQQIVAKKPAE